jgi:hypothetical protein
VVTASSCSRSRALACFNRMISVSLMLGWRSGTRRDRLGGAAPRRRHFEPLVGGIGGCRLEVALGLLTARPGSTGDRTDGTTAGLAALAPALLGALLVEPEPLQAGRNWVDATTGDVARAGGSSTPHGAPGSQSG